MFLILWALAGFRLTCYYHREVPTAKRFGRIRLPVPLASRSSGYLGERSFPLILQNIHRDFLYLALRFIVILSYDAWKGFWFEDSISLENGWLKRRVKNAIIAGFSE